jgi:hypothetical protein
MPDPFRPATTSRKSQADEEAKIARLRELRLADNAARQKAGTWGDVSVGEIVHEPTGEVFVHCWKGRAEPDLAKLYRKRAPDISIEEHDRLQQWVAGRKAEDFKQSLVGWYLSRAEANRVKRMRLEELRAAARDVVNDPPSTE